MRTFACKPLAAADAIQRVLALIGVVLAALVLMGAVAGCSIQSDKKKDGKAENVEINTPFFSASVTTDEADAKHVGLPEYPGARRKKVHDGDNESARVSFDTGGFAFKVVAISYESDDARDKVLDFYRQEMKRMGPVTECKGDIDIDVDKHEHSEREPACKADRAHPEKVELAVRAGGGHRIVSVRPSNKGSEFSMVYIQTRGEDDTI